MKRPARMSCSRRSFPGVSMVLFGLAGAVACSGQSDPHAGQKAAASDAGTIAPAPASTPASPEQSLAMVRQLAAERPALAHLSPDAPSALRLHGTKVIPKPDVSRPQAIDADIPATYTERVSTWPIGKKSVSLSMRPLVGGASLAEMTEDGHAVYRDVYGHADVVRSLEDGALHETIILRDAQAPEYMNWELLLGDKSLRPVEIDDGEIVLVDGKGVGRLKLSAVTIVGADGKERQASFSLKGSELGLSIPRGQLAYPAAATFSVSTPKAGQQFATAPVQIKGRLMVILDTSGSMTEQFGNGNTAPPGADGDSSAVFCDNNLGTNGGAVTYGFACNGASTLPCTTANGGRPDFRLTNPGTTPSRMYAAKQALTNVVTAHSGLLDFGLERYAEDGACTNATYCCTPATGTTTAGRCQGNGFYYAPTGLPGSVLTYSGGCGTVTSGGFVLVQPGATSGAAVLPWVDQVENFCDDSTGKARNPELRADGSTPLGRSVLSAMTSWYQPILNVSKGAGKNVNDPLYDPLIDCRSYVLVVMTDGDDTCSTNGTTYNNQFCTSAAQCTSGTCAGSGGNRRCTCATNADCAANYNCQNITGGVGVCRELHPSDRVAQMHALNATNPVTVYTMGMGDPAGINTTELNAMMTNGGSGQTTAPVAVNQTDIEAAFADIVSRTVKFEVCNNADDNCNALVDEGLGVFQECTQNSDCGSNSCNQGRCTCTTNAQCASGNSCGNGFCRPACSVGVGACLRNGVRKCSASAGACCVNDNAVACTTLTAGQPGTEICNGIDDNCNGIIDDVPGGCQGCVPLPETCDGADQDCDNIKDNNLTDTGKPCGSSVGVCKPGTTVCQNAGTSSATLICQGAVNGQATDPCNGLDDNCDGVVDGNTQACYTGPNGTQNVGICRGGTQQCTAVLGSGVPAFGPCVGQVLPGTETCNGLDDDCNGAIDDVPGLNASCCPAGSCGVGICKAGKMQCSGGSLQCIGSVGPGTEVCNGVDDDCNGKVDDVAGLNASCCPSGSCGKGVCVAGTTACQGNQLVCQNAVGPSTEICDGADNDCNGTIDDLPGKGQSCCPANVSCGVGICKAGTLQCPPAGAALQCLGFTGPGTETCNGVDDDCNNVVDDVAGSGSTCCTSGKCGAGICIAGVKKCVGSTLSCVGEVLPGTEVCNGIDDDCNGKTDDVAGLGGSCCRFKDPLGNDLCGVGLCSTGTLQCQTGSATPVCVGGTGPTAEVCNGKDDNCDGTVDNLPGGTVGASCCPSGKCGVGICAGGTLQCGSNGLLTCTGATNPGAEVCNGLDDDCNTKVDDVPGTGQTCCPPGVPCGTGICKTGTLQCPAPGGGTSLVCTGFTDKQTEVCNGLDDDCNGIVDDVAGAGDACCSSGKCGIGACQSGVQKCVQDATAKSWSLVCTGEVPPGVEICDQLDNDCNGIKDDVTGAGGPCCPYKDSSGNDLCGVGICQAGSLQCIPGKTTLQCQGAIGPVPEICDGLDNDCNGVKDDLPGGTVGGSCCPSGRCGTGICTAGMLSCGPTGIECIGAQNPQGEICDGLDNDCDGKVDNIPNDGQPCCPSGAATCHTGVCTPGIFKCTKSGPAGQETYALDCSGGQQPSTEICDGLDNDCNGIVDDVPGLNEPCCPDGSPQGTAPEACNKGVCRPGVTQCDVPNQKVVCVGGKGPEPNKCDGKDNNCDGKIDEPAEIMDDPQIGKACDEPQPPADHLPCKPGTTICRGAKPVCDGAVGPKDETCDGLDNNCDGVVDDQAPCPTAGNKCVSGVCRSPCRGNEFVRCPGGLVCSDGYCVPPGSAGTGGSGNGTGGNGNGAGGNGSGKDGGTAGNGTAGNGNAGGGGTGNGAGGNGTLPDGGLAGSGNGAGGALGGPDGSNGTSGNGNGASNGSGDTTGSSGSSATKRDVYGLATGGGGCACRTSGGDGHPARSLSVVALIGLALAARRRTRRAA